MDHSPPPPAPAKTLLHIGCGRKTLAETTPGFANAPWREIRLDVEPLARPDIVADMTNMRALPDGSVDAIFSCHNLEHLAAHEVPRALGEFCRVLSPGGFAIITCPDLQSACEMIARGQLTEPAFIAKAGPITPFDILYGHRYPIARGLPHMAHRSGFTQALLAASLRRSGFATSFVARRTDYLDLWAIAAKSLLSTAELSMLAAQHLPPNTRTGLLADDTLDAIPPIEDRRVTGQEPRLTSLADT